MKLVKLDRKTNIGTRGPAMGFGGPSYNSVRTASSDVKPGGPHVWSSVQGFNPSVSGPNDDPKLFTKVSIICKDLTETEAHFGQS